MTDSVFYLLLFVFLGLTSGVGFFLPLYRAFRDGRKPAAPGTPGELIRPQPGVIHVVGEGARAVRYVFHPATKHAPSKLTVQLECAVVGEFEVSRETDADRFWKRIGLTVEIQTGDAGFDREFYLASDHVRFTQAAFALSAVREAVGTLTAEGCQRISLEGGQLHAVREPFDPDRDWTPEAVPRIAVPLAALAAALPRNQVVPRRLGLPAGESRRRAVTVVASGGCFMGLTSLTIALTVYGVLDSGRLVGWALAVGVMGWLALLALMVALLRGGSRAHRGFVMNAFMALLGVATIAVGLAHGLNAWLDSAPATSKTLLVTDRHITRNKNRGTGYRLDVQSWRPGQDFESFPVSRAVYDGAKLGASRIVVHTKPGALGFERITRFEVVSP